MEKAVKYNSLIANVIDITGICSQLKKDPAAKIIALSVLKNEIIEIIEISPKLSWLISFHYLQNEFIYYFEMQADNL